MKLSPVLIALGCLLLLGTFPAQAQLPPPWTAFGPNGGEITAFVQDPSDPDRLYAGSTGRGVFFSQDRGASWRITDGQLQSPVRALSVGTGSTQGVWAAAADGIYASFNHGRTWEKTATSSSLAAFALSAGPRFVFAGNSNLYRYNGVVWALISPGGGSFPSGTIFELAHDRQGRLLVASLSGLFVSSDGGISFTHLGAADFGVVRSVVEDLRSEALFVSTLGGDLFRSNPERTEWERISRALPSLALDQGFAQALPGGAEDLYVLTMSRILYRSSDGGLTWTALGEAPQQTLGAVQLSTNVDNPQRLWAFGAGGLGIGTHRGTVWQPRNQGLYNFELTDYIVAPGSPGTALASSPWGDVQRTFDGGESWQLINQEAVSFAAPLALDPTDSQKVYLGVSGGVRRSADQGTTWEISRPPMPCSEVDQLAVAPSDPDIVYATSFSVAAGCTISIPEACFAHRSDDGGATFRCIPEPAGGLITDLEVDPRDADRVYALSSSRVERSDDGGKTWTVLREASGGFQDLLLDPRNPDHLLLSQAGGIFRSTDRGETWLRWDLPQGPGALTALVAHPIHPDNIYGVLRYYAKWSKDGGRTWRNLPQPTPEISLEGPLRISADQPLKLFTGTSNAGVLARPIPVDTQCVPDDTTLCTGGGENDNRFAVSVTWKDFSGRTGQGRALANQQQGSGLFWFFGPQNIELAVKILDGRPVNDHWWVFYASLTNVEFTLTVHDTATGQVREYQNPPRNFASRGDTLAFQDTGLLPNDVPGAPLKAPLENDPLTAGATPAEALEGLLLPHRLDLPTSIGDSTTDQPLVATSDCVADGASACLASRFRLTVNWRDFQDRTGVGTVSPVTEDTSRVWFFSRDNTELLVKILDGRAINGHWWVFFGSLTNVEFTLTVDDTMTGEQVEYVNPLRNFASRGDTRAFDE